MTKDELTYRRLALTEADLRQLTVSFRQVVTGRVGERIYYGTYSDFLDQARIMLFESAGYPGELTDIDEGWYFPVIGYSLKILSPVHSGEMVEVTGWCHRLSGVRGWMGFTVKNLASGKTAAHGYSEHCFVDRVTMKPIAPNPEWRIFRKIREHAAGGGRTPAGADSSLALG